MTQLAQRRAQGLMTLADEEHVLRMTLAMYERADKAARKAVLPMLRQSLVDYEAAIAKSRKDTAN